MFNSRNFRFTLYMKHIALFKDKIYLKNGLVL